jgi:hypothetical protein
MLKYSTNKNRLNAISGNSKKYSSLVYKFTFAILAIISLRLPSNDLYNEILFFGSPIIAHTTIYILPLLFLIPKYSQNTTGYFGHPTINMLPFALFFLVMSLSVIVNMVSINSFRYFGKEILLSCLWLICAILGQKIFPDRFFKYIVVTGGILLILTIIIILLLGYDAYMVKASYSTVDEISGAVQLSLKTGYGYRWRFTWPGINTNQAVSTLLLILFVSLWIFHSSQGRIRLFASGSMIISLLFVMISYSRQGIFLLFFGFLLFSYFGLAKKKLVYFGLIGLIIYFIFFDKYLWARILSLLDAFFGTDYSAPLIISTSSRLERVYESIPYILDNPILGMGYDQFRSKFSMGAVHVDFLAFSMIYGLVAAIIRYLCFFIIPLIYGIKMVKKFEPSYERDLLIFFCIICFLLTINSLVAPIYHAHFVFSGYLSGLLVKCRKRLGLSRF